MKYLEIRNKEALRILEKSKEMFEEYKSRAYDLSIIHSIITKKKNKGLKKYNCLIIAHNCLMSEGYILEFDNDNDAKKYEHDVNELLNKAGIDGSVKVQ